MTVQPLRALVPVPWLEEIVPTIQLGQSSAVTAGHRATVDHHGLQAVATLSDRSAVTDWERGRLAFDDESLRNAVEVVNRYSRKPIVIADADIEELRITGTVVGDHVDGWVASLEAAFGIRAQDDAQSITLKR